MTSQRPEKLSSQTKLGFYTSWLPENSHFEKFIEQAIFWAESSPKRIKPDEETAKGEYSYGILDTFFADFISPSCVKEILDSCSSNAPLRILLLDPSSLYAVARASHLTSNAASARMAKGIAKLTRAAQEWAGRPKSTYATNTGADFAVAANVFQETVNEFAVPLELRYYSVIPSGPLLFLQDILISGKFCFDRSSTQLPWYMHVDDPQTNQGTYDIHLSEFDSIWGHESTTSETPTIPDVSNSKKVGHDFGEHLPTWLTFV